MPGTFFGLEIGRRGLQTHQRALDVTGHNLTNASTEGYTRQEAVFTQTDPYTSPDWDSAATPGQLGTGVTTSMIKRIRDEYMDPQFRNSNTGYYYWDSQTDIFNRVQACFADLPSNTSSDASSSGISDQLVTFFKGWQNLNNNPQDTGAKAAVVENGVQLADLMTSTYKQMDDLQNSVVQIDSSNNVQSGQMKDEVERINDLLTQVQNYTEDIKRVYQNGQQPNDLLDKRDLLLDELSQYGPLTVTQETVSGQPTGNLTMNFFGVDITTTPRTDKTFSLQIDNSSGTDHVQLYEAGQGLVKDLTQAVQDGDTQTGGSLLGLESARQSIIGFKNTLNDIANNLSQKIVDKNNTAPSAGVTNFFAGSLDNGDFAVNNTLISDPSNLDGTKALAISDISSEVMGSEAMSTTRNYTLSECYSMLVTDVGSKAKGANDMSTSQKAINDQISNLRTSVSGVSTDEELTKMIQYQYGYQGSARVVSMVDDLLNYLINNMVQFSS